MIFLSPVVRRIVYVALFEAIAIILSTLLLMFLSDGDAKESLPVAVAVSVIAVIWNYLFNTAFEFWERFNRRTARNFYTRVAHAALCEVGLFLFTVPLYMWWYEVGPWRAFTMEAAILAFFLLYTFIFTWLFDLVFSLPGNQRVSA